MRKQRHENRGHEKAGGGSGPNRTPDLPLDVMHIRDLPRETLRGGKLERTAIRSQGSLVTFNLFQPGVERAPPHSHPFDQLAIIVSGQFRMYVEEIAHDMPAGSALLIPAGHAHSGHPVGGEPVINIDVFAPVRGDYLHLVEHQKFREGPPRDKQADLDARGQGRPGKSISAKRELDREDG